MENFEQLDMFSTESIDSLLDIIIASNPESYDYSTIKERIAEGRRHFDMKISFEICKKFKMFWDWQEDNTRRNEEMYCIRLWINGSHKGEWALTGLGMRVGMMWYSNIDNGEQSVINRLKMLIEILNGGSK